MKRMFAVLIALCSCLTLGGCELWLNGSYSSVTPHIIEEGYSDPASLEVESYTELNTALLDLVENGTADCVLYSRSLTSKQLSNYLDSSIRSIRREHPIGAWAVSAITYDIGTNSGRTAIAIQIAYSQSRTQILRLQTVTDMDQVREQLARTLNNCDAGFVLRVDNYSSLDYTQIVQDYMDQNPDICMEMPQVTCVTYPQMGKERVVEVNFAYKTSREILRSMQETVQPVFSSAKLYVNGDMPVQEQYAQLYSFLMGRDTYTVQTSITPAYSLLNHGVGDSKAFAVVYAAMCRQSGLDCEVVSGTRGGVAWSWNVIKLEDAYYHIDILQCSTTEAGFILKPAEEMLDYVWDYSAYE